MPPAFPYLIGRVAVDDHWTVDLPFVMRRRVEDSELVLWRSTFTISLSIWHNTNHLSLSERLEYFRSKADAASYQERVEQDGDRLYLAYRVPDSDDDTRQAPFEGVAFDTDGHLKLSVFFHDESLAEQAWTILRSASREPPSPPDASILSREAFVTRRVVDEGRNIGLMSREPSARGDDSGWRFSAGDEPREYIDEPENHVLLPVAYIAQRDRAILPYLNAPSGDFVRYGDEFKAKT